MALKNHTDFTLAAVSAACGKFTVNIWIFGKSFSINEPGSARPSSAVIEEGFAQAEPLSRSGYEPASPWRLRMDKAVDSARRSGFSLSYKVKVTHGGWEFHSSPTCAKQ